MNRCRGRQHFGFLLALLQETYVSRRNILGQYSTNQPKKESRRNGIAIRYFDLFILAL